MCVRREMRHLLAGNNLSSRRKMWHRLAKHTLSSRWKMRSSRRKIWHLFRTFRIELSSLQDTSCSGTPDSTKKPNGHSHLYIYANRAWQALGVSSSFNLGGGGPTVCRTPSVTQHTSHATHATCMTLDIWAQASMFEHSQWTHFENPPTRTHANRN